MMIASPQLPRPLPFVDALPEWLGPLFLLLGVASLVLWVTERALERVTLVRTSELRVLLLLLVVLGTVFTTVGALAEANVIGQFSLVLVAAGRFVEGGAVVRGVRKIWYILRTRSMPGDDQKLSAKLQAAVANRRLPDGTAKIRSKIEYVVIRAGIGLGALLLYIAALWVGGLTESTLYAITLTWTLSVFMLAVIGLSWKLEYASKQLPASLIIGLLAASAGAQIYNYVNLVWDVTAIVIGTIAFAAGIIAGAVAVLVS